MLLLLGYIERGFPFSYTTRRFFCSVYAFWAETVMETKMGLMERDGPAYTFVKFFNFFLLGLCVNVSVHQHFNLTLTTMISNKKP